MFTRRRVPGRGENHWHLAARAIEVRLNDLQHETCSYCCVERVTAILQHRHTSRRRQPMRRGHHAEGANQLGAGGEHAPNVSLTRGRGGSVLSAPKACPAPRQPELGQELHLVKASRRAGQMIEESVTQLALTVGTAAACKVAMCSVTG